MLFVRSLPWHLVKPFHIWFFLSICIWFSPFVASLVFSPSTYDVFVDKAITVLFICVLVALCYLKYSHVEKADAVLGTMGALFAAHVLLAVGLMDLFPTADSSGFLMIISVGLLCESLWIAHTIWK